MDLWLNLRQGTLIALFTLILVVPFGCERQGRSQPTGFPASFADLAARVTPAVVNISTTSTVVVPGNPFRHFPAPGDDSPLSELFKRFHNQPDREMKQLSIGSGIIISGDGYVVTNNHMVDETDEIRVKISGGRELKARVVGRDVKTDLALLKISSPVENLPVLNFGDSDKMRVGDWVLAVGNPFGLEHTVTQGIISATGRVLGSGPFDDFLQTDTPINPGNSGGPLVNLKGEVIGITTAIVPGGQGIGFAIPSALAKPVLAQLKAKGRVVRGWIGVGAQPVTPEIARSFALQQARGALVGDVEPQSPAQRAGIRQGDVIVSFAGRAVKDANALSRQVADAPVGKRARVQLVREGREVAVSVLVREMPEEQQALRRTSVQARTLGLRVEELSEAQRQQAQIEEAGLVVVELEPGGSADQAGVRRGDLVKEVNRQPVRTVAEYQKAVHEVAPGQPVLLLLRRGKQTLYASLEQR